tara:strand:- start:41 stop:256 length:216 start_codon:yes stop_codon:yes gene_type:complete
MTTQEEYTLVRKLENGAKTEKIFIIQNHAPNTVIILEKNKPMWTKPRTEDINHARIHWNECVESGDWTREQ